MKKYASIVLVAALLSIGATIALVRLCIKTEYVPYFSMVSLICGNDLAATAGSFRRLQPSEVLITSAIPESEEFSITTGNDAAKLMDGNENTSAAPASSEIDYQITFLQEYEIKQVVILWKDYGINENYIREWSIESMGLDEKWNTVLEGHERPRGETVINKRFTASGIRIRATSAEDWIGVYEVTIIGKPL